MDNEVMEREMVEIDAHCYAMIDASPDCGDLTIGGRQGMTLNSRAVGKCSNIDMSLRVLTHLTPVNRILWDPAYPNPSRTSAETDTRSPTPEETLPTPNSPQLLSGLPRPLPTQEAEDEAALLAPAMTQPPPPSRTPEIPASSGEGDGSPIEDIPEDVAVGESEASATLPTRPLDVQVPPPTEVGNDSLSISSPPQDAGSGSPTPMHTPTWAGDIEVYPPSDVQDHRSRSPSLAHEDTIEDSASGMPSIRREDAQVPVVDDEWNDEWIELEREDENWQCFSAPRPYMPPGSSAAAQGGKIVAPADMKNAPSSSSHSPATDRHIIHKAFALLSLLSACRSCVNLETAGAGE
jgi:hypothetical protein